MRRNKALGWIRFRRAVRPVTNPPPRAQILKLPPVQIAVKPIFQTCCSSDDHSQSTEP
jgi:hypothetical protein